jgi:hypothetical protein
LKKPGFLKSDILRSDPEGGIDHSYRCIVILDRSIEELLLNLHYTLYTMGRSQRSEERKSSKKDSSKEDRLLRKAKDYIQQKESSKSHSQEHRKSSRREDDEGDGGEEERRPHRDKDRKRRRTRDDKEDDREDDRRHRKSHKSHRTTTSTNGDDKDRKQRKHESNSKTEHKKRHKKESSSSSSHKREKDRKPSKKDLVPMGEPLGHPPNDLLDAVKDYFAFHQQLFVYLYREEGSAFNDLTSDETRQAFGRFVERYNAGKLEATYYDPKGLPPAAVEESKTTRHNWSFQTTDTEVRSLQYLQEGVRKQTEFDGDVVSTGGSGPRIPTAPQPAVAEVTKPSVQPRRTAEDNHENRVSNRRIREHVRTVDEEFGGGGKKYGRERQIEKRKEVGARTHGAARDREGATELTDDAIFGAETGGDVGFKTALAREKQRTAQREEKKNSRFAELQKKEDDKKEAMLKLLGLDALKPGQKITIAPRKDN